MKIKKISIFVSLCLICLLFCKNTYAQDSVQTAQKTMLLESLGIQSSSNLYFAYLSLLYLDKSIKGDENPEDLKSVVNGIININNIINENYLKVLNSGILENSDSLFISKAKAITQDIKNSSDLFMGYVESKSDKDHDKFIQSLNEAWEKLKKLFESAVKQ